MSSGVPARNRSAPDSLKRGDRIPLGQRISSLVEKIKKSIADGAPLNFSESAHREITEALHILLYGQDSELFAVGHRQLKVVYGDGSKGKALELAGLSQKTHEFVDGKDTLNVGTLSFRHLDYDSRIDLYLIRDRETRFRSNGEIDELAYERAKKVFEDPALRERNSSVVIFQTGLEPLVVGVYRALIEELLERRKQALPSLVVQPMFYTDADKGRGRVWS